MDASRRDYLGAVASHPVAGILTGDGLAATETTDTSINPILEPTGDWNDRLLRAPTIYQTYFASQYRMLFDAAGDEDYGAIYSASSDDLVDWSTDCQTPVLEPLNWQDWITGPSVLRYEGELHVWFGQRNSDNYRFTIGHAAGPNLQSIERRETYALEPEPGGWERGHVRNPDVLYHDGKLWMYYMGHDKTDWSIGLATSDDGETWIRHPDNPLLTSSDADWEDSDVANPGVCRWRDRWLCFYEGLGNRARIGVASSLQPDRFDRYMDGPLIVPDDDWNSYQVFDAEPFVVNQETLLVYYTGHEQGGSQKIGVSKYKLR